MSNFDDDEEDERFLHLLQEYFLESPPFLLVASSPPPHHHNPASVSLQKVLEEKSDCETKILEKVLLYMNEKGHHENIKEFVVLRLKMDNYEASLCKTSWISTTFGTPKVYEYTGEYEYIDIMMIKDNDVETPKRVIIDLDFKSQFEVVRPTESYRELIDALPCIFVGGEEKLKKIISLLCTEAKQSLKKRGLHVPPWRKLGYMQSKWLSEKCSKNSVCS
ncbi:Aldehyde dehydrogenase family [Heracleum sosnowskyi]|uniref:Aldehyde dehydrogenase family n=1 Tax=Heracleum sosnowskyi TaxID=360622 RepID=A0AAD8N0D7_9APIA|nr:Aldehyde dehydrogenase family [Heracleum sosnowskyi]